MQFSYCKIKNFKAYGNETIEFDLSKNGVNLITGINGAGKSTFVSAIIWCLYGKSEGNVSDLINRKIKKDCKVEVGFYVDGDNYSIIRFRNHSLNGNKLIIFKNGNDISRRTITETQELIQEIIQIEYEAMISNILLSSETYIHDSFLRSRPSNRLKILENVLSLNEIQDYYDYVKKAKRNLTDKVDELVLQEEKINVEVSTLTSNINEYKESIKKQLTSLKKSREKKEKNVEKLLSELSTLKKLSDEKIEIELEKIKAYEEVVKFNEDLERQKKQIEQKEDITPLVNEYNEIRERKTELGTINIKVEKDKIKLYDKIIKDNLEIDNKILQLSNEISNTDENLLKEIEEKILLLKKEITSISENREVCPLCGQPVDKDFTDREIEKRNQLIKKLQDDYLQHHSDI